MRPTAAASSSSSKAAGKEKIRRKGGGASDQLLTDHVLSLRARLHDALALGLTRSDGQGVKKWQSTDAGIQFHALKAMASFIGSLSNEMLRLPPVKDSISDILIALEGVLQTKNVPVLIHATEVCLKLISSLGNSIRQYPIVDIVTSLSYQLSTEHVPISITCASAMNCILNNLVTARASTNAEIWEALEKTKAIESIISVLQSYAHDVYPLNNLIEMISLLRIILWIWPSSRYFVWSNCNFMRKLEQYCLSTEMAVSANVLKLYAALALCGNGAMVLLKNEGLITSIGELMRESQPSVTRIEALKLCQVLLRSSKGCKLLMNSHCQLTVQGIINAMSTSDEKYLVTEGCRTALLLVRYAGNHHRYFWSNAIDEVLYTILTGSCISSHQAHQILCHNKLFDIVTKNIMDIHCYVWDILGHLVVNCNNEYFSLGKGNIYFLQALISCACSLATDVVQKSSSIKLTKDQQEPALRAVLMMLLSPCGYISSEASSNFLQVLHLGDDYLNILLSSLKSNVARSVTASYDIVKIMTNLMNLACLVMLQPYHNLLNKGNAVDVLSTIIKECLHNDLHITRLKVTSHLQFCFDGDSCCLFTIEEWEGENIVLFYGLVVLFNLLKSITFVCVHCGRNLNSGIVCHDCRHHYTVGLIRVLQNALCQNLSPGPRCYIAHILSLFGFCGFPSKLGGKMKSALDDNELVDLKFLLSDGESLNVHTAVISGRCPKLLPSAKSLDGDGKHTDEWGRSFRCIRISDRVDSRALKKIVEYTYSGFVLVDDDIVKPVRTLAKYCHLNSLHEMLEKEQPRWNSAYTKYDLTAALEPVEYSFLDIILEAQSNEEMKCQHSSCQLSSPHVHSHKIVLSRNCHYFRALFQSGMHESFSDVIKVPLGRDALDKLIQWFYSGELPKVAPDCRWKNLSKGEQLSHLRPYVELSSLAEFWLLEEVKEESLAVVTSCLSRSTTAAIEFIAAAAELGQWEMVDAGVRSVAHLYPKLRDSGKLEQLEEGLLDMVRTEYVRYSQSHHVPGRCK